MRRRVVVTGLGAITPVGNDVATTWQSMLAGVSGGGPITKFDASTFKVRFACEVKGFDPALYMERKEAKRADLFTQYALAASVEAGSSHPIARALRAYTMSTSVATAIAEELGRGIAGRVNGRAVLVGAPAWVRARATSTRPVMEGWIAELAERGETPVVIAVDGTAVAVVGLADPIRPESRAALDELVASGWHVQLLSGDDARVARRVGTALGLDPEACHGGVGPPTGR